MTAPSAFTMRFAGYSDQPTMNKGWPSSRPIPDLAGKLAAAKRLTVESSAEQASAGLDALSDEERATFTELNRAYVDKNGFPFIIAVRDHDKAGILDAFKQRLQHDREVEFEEACRQVERIARLRLDEHPAFAI